MPASVVALIEVSGVSTVGGSTLTTTQALLTMCCYSCVHTHRIRLSPLIPASDSIDSICNWTVRQYSIVLCMQVSGQRSSATWPFCWVLADKTVHSLPNACQARSAHADQRLVTYLLSNMSCPLNPLRHTHNASQQLSVYTWFGPRIDTSWTAVELHCWASIGI